MAKRISYGVFSEFYITDDMQIKYGKLAGHDNAKAVWVELIENDAHSILIQCESEDICKSSIAYAKESHEGAQDVSVSLGGRTWTGVTYRYMDMMDCFAVYAMDGDDGILINASWYTLQDVSSTIILSSIKLRKTPSINPTIFKNGIVKSDIFASTFICPYDTNIYVEQDGSSWIKIFHHNNPKRLIFPLYSQDDHNYFSSPVHIDNDKWFYVNICNQIMNNTYEFMVKQKAASTDTEEKYRWVQTKNPMTCAYSDVDVADVTINTSSGYTALTNYGGIYYKNSSTYLCVNNANSGNWMGAIGSWTAWNNGIPGWGKAITSGYLDLYLRIDNQSAPFCSVFDTHIQASDLIEW